MEYSNESLLHGTRLIGCSREVYEEPPKDHEMKDEEGKQKDGEEKLSCDETKQVQYLQNKNKDIITHAFIQ